VTGLKRSLSHFFRDIRTAAWWHAHRFMILPWLGILVLILSTVAIYQVHDGFRAEIDHAVALVKSGDQEALRDYLLGYGAWAPVVSVIIMIAQAVIVGIPASIVMFANGVAFGTGDGAVINIIGRMAGAIISFGIARSLGKGAVENLVGKLTHTKKFETWMEQRGGLAVFATRVIPGMPSDMLSYVAGFTKVSWRTYFIATLLGFLPQSIVFAWFGAEATGWFWVVMMSGSILTGVLAVTAFIVQWVRRRKSRRVQPVASPVTGYTLPAISSNAARQPAPQRAHVTHFQRFL
jgi:uncharacterized membrane protein YdjX (TVP38/TMEM64 family)